MSITQISRDEWLKALGDAIEPPDPDAVTLAELAALLGVDRQMAYRHVKKLIKDGKAAIAVKYATTASGLTKRVAAYRLVKHEARPAARRR